MTDYKREWIREFHRFARRTDIWRAFEDWCQLAAIELSNRVDWTQADARDFETCLRLAEKAEEEKENKKRE